MKGKGSILIKIGIFLIACAVILAGYNIITGMMADRASQKIVDAIEVDDEPFNLMDPDMEMPATTIGGTEYIGRIEIPAISINLPVASDWDYNILRISPGRYYGSAYKDNMIIAAHNYRNHFGRFTSLAGGDKVIFTDVKGNVFEYEISDIEIIDPYDIDGMKEGDWDLTMFTCTLGGRTRLTVRCDRTSEDIV